MNVNLCTPATIYLVLSAIGIILIAFQNYGMSPNMYCVGNVRCPVQTTTPIFIMKILYVAFWTFILNALCIYGYNQLAWFLLLLPFILFFMMILLVGSFLHKRTTSVPSMPSPSSSPFYQQQADAQAAQMQDRDRKRIHAPDSEQDKWFEPNRWFPGSSAQSGGGGSGYYSSYGDYDRALDQRTKQVYNESHENVQKNIHYK
jgi:hypothetical protein